MTGSNKMWSKPELTVLVRSKPEEMVLASCKTTFSGTGAAGPSYKREGYCFNEDATKCPGSCDAYTYS